MPSKTKKTPEKKAPPAKPVTKKKSTRRKKVGKRGNQYALDPRQDLFLAKFLDPESTTFGNAQQSALKAGYKPHYAKQITARMPEWMREKVEDAYLLRKAEDNIKEMLEMEDINTAATKAGDVYDFKDPKLTKIKADVSRFVVERLNKKKWSPRAEITGAGGSQLVDVRGNPDALTTLLKVALTAGERIKAAHDNHKKSQG